MVNINNYFKDITEHNYTQWPFNNHLLEIIKLIIKYYMTVRLHHYNKELIEPKTRIRSHLTKIITIY